MGKDKLENLFNEQLHSYHSEINTDDLWNDISPSVDSRSPGKVTVIYVLAGLGLIVLLWCFGRSIMISNDTQNVVISQNKDIEESFVSSQDKHKDHSTMLEKVEMISDYHSSSNVDSKDDLISKNVSEDMSKVTEVLPLLKTPNEKVVRANSNLRDNKLVNHILNDKAINPDNSSTPSRNSSKEINTNEDKKIVSSLSASITSKQYSKTVSEKEEVGRALNDSFKQEFQHEITISNLKNTETRDIDGVTEDWNNQRELLNHIFLSNSIGQMNNYPKFENAYNDEKIYHITFSEDHTRYNSINQIKDGFSLGLQFLPLYSISMFSSIDSLKTDAYRELRSSTEKYQEAFTIRASGMYQWKSGLYAQAAIDYGQIDERFEYYESTIDTVMGQVPSTIFVNDNNQMDTLFEKGLLLRESYTDAKVYNYHRFIDISLGLGYRIPIQKNLAFYIDGNVGLNVASWHKGMVLSSMGGIEDIRKDALYKNKLGFKVNANLGIQWRQAAFSYNIGPSIIYHTNNWLEDKNLLEQRYLKLGLHLGMHYMF